MKYNQPIGAAEGAAYIDANPGLGIDGSPVPAAAIEAAQREILAVITAAGIAPDKDDLTQLLAALRSGLLFLTPPQFDNDRSVATTEFVQRALGSIRGSSIAVSGNTALVGATVTGKNVQLSGSGPYTVTLPLITELVGGSGFGLIATGTGIFTIQRQGPDSIYHALNNVVTSFSMMAGDIVWITEDGGAWNISAGSKLLQYMPQFGASISTNGYQKLPSGLIIQWGMFSGTGVSTGTITFPIAFPNACLGCYPVDVQNVATQVGSLGALPTLSNFAWAAAQGAAAYSGINTFNWFSIGW